MSAASTAETALHTPQGSTSSTPNGDFVSDSGMDWAVTLRLTPEELRARPDFEHAEQWRIAVAAAAAQSRASWDAEGIDRFLADASSGGPGAESFFTMSAPEFRIHLVIEAASRTEALEIARAACTPPLGFNAIWIARPADLEE